MRCAGLMIVVMGLLVSGAGMACASSGPPVDGAVSPIDSLRLTKGSLPEETQVVLLEVSG